MSNLREKEQAEAEGKNTFAKIHPPPDFWTAAGLSCALCFRSDGLGKAMELMLAMLRGLTPVCRINIGCSSLAGKKFYVPLADTDKKGMSQTRVPTPENPFSIIREDLLERPTIINKLAPYKQNALEMDSSVVDLPFYCHNALLRLPLFCREELIFWINFWSDNEDCFSGEDLKHYSRLMVPCMEDLREALDYKNETEESPEAVSSFKKLECCPGLDGVCARIRKIAPTNASVLIQGESGSGKELVAEAIHELSRRNGGPLVRVNCGAVAPTLLESELFGSEKGAYTGAGSLRYGYFEFAGSGTIFMDEIGEMPLAAQVRLLRVLENHTIQRLGSPQPRKVDVRVVAATNRDLQKMVEAGQFRKDLYYRLAVCRIEVPPLRMRREDILPLAKNILAIKARELGLPKKLEIGSREGMRLLAHDWPGNVRELANVVERSLIMRENHYQPLRFLIDEERRGDEAPADIASDWPTLEEMEKRYIEKVLAKTCGQLSGKNGATDILGIHYTTLHAKIKRYRLRRNGQD